MGADQWTIPNQTQLEEEVHAHPEIKTKTELSNSTE